MSVQTPQAGKMAVVAETRDAMLTAIKKRGEARAEEKAAKNRAQGKSFGKGRL